MTIGLILLFFLVFFLVFGTPIVAAVGLASVLTMLSAGHYNSLPSVAQKMFTSIDSFPLLALPLFTLSGALMEVSGISERLVIFMKMVFRRLPAASACITTISATFFGAISGSAPATAAAIGGVMITPMTKNGYSPEEAAAINASSGSLGIIIPPSIPMVVFATTASVSVGSLFMSGVTPGVLIMAVFCIIHVIKFRRIEKSSPEKTSFRDGWRIFVDAIFALGMPVVILGGIYGGIFTPTEAAAVSCVYALFVGGAIYRSLGVRQIFETLQMVGIRVSSMLTIVCAATGMAWYVSSSGLAKQVATAILTGMNSQIAILTSINLLLFFLGCFLDPTSIILLTCPIILPITKSFGMSGVAVGAFFTVNMAVGMITPPMAGTIYVSSQIAKLESIGDMTAKIIPYLLAMMAITLLITYFPEISIGLPRLLGMSI
jgi:C4-dicarboxylate transporter DctM subunit